MSDITRARARAQFYGPEMLSVVEKVIAQLEGEIVDAEPMSQAEVTSLLLSILEPLVDIRDLVITGEDPTET